MANLLGVVVGSVGIPALVVLLALRRKAATNGEKGSVLLVVGYVWLAVGALGLILNLTGATTQG